MTEGTNVLSQQLQDVVARSSMVRKSNSYTINGTNICFDGESPLRQRWSVVQTTLWDGGDRACILQISYRILRGVKPEKYPMASGNVFYLLPEHMEVSSWGQ